MTEREYIDATDLAKVRSAIAVLRQILPENSTVITRPEYGEVMPVLYHWQDQLEALAKVTEFEEE